MGMDRKSVRVERWAVDGGSWGSRGGGLGEWALIGDH